MKDAFVRMRRRDGVLPRSSKYPKRRFAARAIDAGKGVSAPVPPSA